MMGAMIEFIKIFLLLLFAVSVCSLTYKNCQLKKSFKALHEHHVEVLKELNQLKNSILVSRE